MRTLLLVLAVALLSAGPTRVASGAPDLEARVTHGYADSGGVRIHYASLGSGPLVVMIHGFPDYWYSWRHQMEALSTKYQVVAVDQRGEMTSPVVMVKAPVLMFHGLDDTALMHPGLNGTWEWLEQDLTLVTIPAPATSCSRTPPIS